MKGKTARRGLKVWPLGVSIIKTELYGWLRQDSPTEGEDAPAGFCRFPEYDSEYFKMLTAEELRVKFVKGFKRYEWEKIRSRNESLDCRVYARGAAAICGMDRFTEKNWATLETSLAPKEPAKSQTQKKKKRKKRESIW